MEVIAQTKDGFLIEASNVEVKSMAEAIYGVGSIGELKVGLTIPGVNYAATVTNLEEFVDSYSVRSLVDHVDEFNKKFKGLFEALGDLKK